MREILKAALSQGLKNWLQTHNVESVPDFSVDAPPSGIAGDVAANLPLLLAQTLKKPPRTIAQEMAQELSHAPFASRVEVAGPGFLNIHLSDDFLQARLREAVSAPSQALLKESVLIEYVSANPTGPLHVGHGRGAALGDSLARVWRFLGARVTREFYVNDMGLQMENLVASILNAVKSSNILGGEYQALAQDILSEKSEADFYKGAYVADLARDLAVNWKNCNFSNRNEFFAVVKKGAVDSMLGSIRHDLNSFRVEFDEWTYESSLHAAGLIQQLLGKYKQKNMLEEREGAVFLKLTECGLSKDEVLRRSNGAPTYFAADIAYHAQKLERGFDRLVDLWGADHHGHVERTKKALASLGLPAEKLTIVLFQLVALLRGGKVVPMGKREGEFITLKQVMDEVGTDACRFFFAMRSPGSHLDFDLDLAKKQSQENPVFYVQYVHARITSIFNQAGLQSVALNEGADWKLLNQPEERALMLKLASFPDTLLSCVRTLSTHLLTSYLMDLSGLFHRFYDKCRVLSDDAKLTQSRLALIHSVRTVIKNGLDLLGVSAPEKM